MRGAVEAGYDAVVADASRLHPGCQVRFVSMMDFLEHLPGLDVVESVLAHAAEAATDFLFIQHPSFEGEDWLLTQGLRQYWHDWTGHQTHIHVDDFCGMFERLGLRQYMIRYDEAVYDSAHPSILPSEAPRNQHAYDPELHPPKPSVVFPRPVWRAQYIFVALREFSADEWSSLTA